MARVKLEISECYLGYPRDQVVRVIGTGRIAEFDKWMFSQTMAICEGPNQYHPDKCTKAHGSITYPWDVERFLSTKPVVN